MKEMVKVKVLGDNGYVGYEDGYVGSTQDAYRFSDDFYKVCFKWKNGKTDWYLFPNNLIQLLSGNDQHYNNDKGSLYLFAEQHELNAWEFDIIKRITRCRKKGQFIEDLEKTKRVIDLYLKEYDSKTIG
jgi:hypothetical protein